MNGKGKIDLKKNIISSAIVQYDQHHTELYGK